MADPASPVRPDAQLHLDRSRITALLKTLESMAAGDVDLRLAISTHHDELDAIAHGINVLVGELSWAHDCAREAHERRAAELEASVASAEARSSALLKAIPDLMFVLRHDSTFVDYQARDPNLLLVSPETFLGRTVREVMPPPVADEITAAIERACRSDEPVVVEYELSLDELRVFEARLVQAGADRLLVIIREITAARRAAELNRDLARRLIVRQERERQRIARELHDDVSQRLAMLSVEIDRVAAGVGTEQWAAQLDSLSRQVREVARAVHDVSYELHPSRLRAIGLVGAIRELCSDASHRRDLRVTFTHGEIPRVVDSDVSLCVYRIAQEALHNIVRHSGATEALIDLSCGDGYVALQLNDSGVGFDPARVSHAGLGLVSMQERVSWLNGQLSIDAVPGRGTRIDVRIPLVSPPAQSPDTLRDDAAV